MQLCHASGMKYRGIKGNTMQASAAVERESPQAPLISGWAYYLIVGVLTAVFSAVMLWGVVTVRDVVPPPADLKEFTRNELNKHSGMDPRRPILLGFAGKVYDVTKKKEIYGPGGSYHFFAGKDATRAFLTGCFEEECLRSDYKDIAEQHKGSLEHWEEFYAKEYKLVGYLRQD